jgi:hypothetical protein
LASTLPGVKSVVLVSAALDVTVALINIIDVVVNMALEPMSMSMMKAAGR